MDLTLDEIIEQQRTHNPPRSTGKKSHVNHVQIKPRKRIGQPSHPRRPYDARNKIIQKTRAKIIDARDILNQNRRDSGIDARNMLFDRKKERMPMPLPLPPQSPRRLPGADDGGDVNGNALFAREITLTTVWDPEDPYQTSRLNPSAKAFAPRGYVDYDNMQQLEDEETSRTFHLSSAFKSSQRRPFAGYDLDMDMEGVEITAPSNTGGESFSIYETSRHRMERPTLLPPTSLGETVDKPFERRQRNMVASSKLPESLRARLFSVEHDPHVSHGIYANENGSVHSKAHLSGPLLQSSRHQRRSPPSMSLPLSVANNKIGYRLLVSNLHSNVSSSDIRELFNDIGPMYDAHVVRPGTAEVIYKSLEHAEIAVDAYHQREFDGQPMHCVLVNPHSSHRANRSVNSRTVTTNSSGVEVDIDALHSVLFRDR